MSAVHHQVGGEVVEDGGHVEAGEGVGGVRDQEAGLAHVPVADNHAFHRVHYFKKNPNLLKPLSLNAAQFPLQLMEKEKFS